MSIKFTAGCADCPYKGKKVGSRGNPKAPIVIVGESPGIQEVRKGIPFIGPSGDVLFQTLPGGENADVFITNAMCCHPSKEKDVKMMMQATNACKGRLLAEISAHPRELILSMGNYATWSLTGDHSLRITKARGTPIESRLAKRGILPAVHPAALLRGTGSYRQFKEDIDYAFKLAAGAPFKEPILPEWIVHKTKAEVLELVATIKEIVKKLPKGEFLELAADIETSGFNRRADKILCIGIGWDPDLTHIIEPHLIYLLRPLFGHKRIKWIWHNGKFDTAFLRYKGLPSRVDEDTMLMSYALDEVGGIHDLEQVCSDLLGSEDWKKYVKPYLGKGKTYEDIPRPKLNKYLAYDVSGTLQIYRILRQQVREAPPTEKLYTRTLLPASAFLRQVEDRGMLVDRRQLKKNEKRLAKIVEDEKQNIQNIAGTPINPNSPAQLSKFMYIELGLPNKHKGSTDKKALKDLPQIPFIKALKKYRTAAKALSTYVTSIEKAIEKDGRVYPTFNIHGTRTGRLSCKEPNVQNVPREEQLRSTYIASPGFIFMEFDLNQAEIRSLAALSGDPFLCNIYNSTDRSLHNEVAEELFGPDWDGEDKMKAKAVNFGIMYGREAPSLAEEFKVPLREGQRMINDWFKAAPVAGQYIRKCRRAPIKGQTMTTMFGRRKRHHLVSKGMLKAMQNEAANFPHQSIASDINLHAGIRTLDQLRKWGCYIVNLVHDSILIEVPFDMGLMIKVSKLMIGTMEQVPVDWGITAVPFKADFKVGKSWGHLSEHNIVDIEKWRKNKRTVAKWHRMAHSNDNVSENGKKRRSRAKTVKTAA